MRKYKIEIFNKENIFDGLAHNLMKDIFDLGIKSLKDLKVSYLYLIEGNLNLSRIKTICEKLLIDPVTQEYKISNSKTKVSDYKNVHIVEVWYKQGVTDAVGDTTKIGIKDLGIEGDFSVRTGMKYTLVGVNIKEAEKIADKILANKVVQTYKII